MFQEFFASRMDLLLGPKLAFGLFFTVFLGILIWVFFGLRDEEELKRIASLPLEDDTKGGAQGE